MPYEVVFSDGDEEWTTRSEGWLPLPAVGEVVSLPDEDGQWREYRVTERNLFYAGADCTLAFEVEEA